MSSPSEMFLKHVANVIAERSALYGDASTSMAATPPSSIASTNSARVANGKSAPPQRPRRWA